MKSQPVLILLLFGFTFWFAGTLFYRVRGQSVFESTSLRYWINFAVTPLLSAGVCFMVIRLLRVPAQHWASAALLIALPGMAGEVLLLTQFQTFLPRLHAESAGRVAALLFACYALVLAIAEFVTLRVASPSANP